MTLNLANHLLKAEADFRKIISDNKTHLNEGILIIAVIPLIFICISSYFEVVIFIFKSISEEDVLLWLSRPG